MCIRDSFFSKVSRFLDAHLKHFIKRFFSAFANVLRHGDTVFLLFESADHVLKVCALHVRANSVSEYRKFLAWFLRREPMEHANFGSDDDMTCGASRCVT